jgi:tetratricopeptide (TPR) repeat protein
MSPAARVRLAVVVAAVAGAGLVAGIVLATRQSPSQPKARCGRKPLDALIVPGTGKPAINAAVRKAMHSVHALEQLENRHPTDAAVQINFGRALICAGFLADASQALEAAKHRGRDTPYEIDADQLLHPTFFQNGYPIFQPSIGTDPLLVQGAVLQRQGHQHSAERLYAKAARLHPDDPEAQAAAAVGRFDEDNPSASFSRLGPLTKRFPRSQVVRYYLGLLLVWIGERNQAVVEFQKTVDLGPHTQLGRQVQALLRQISESGSNTPSK